MLNMDYIDKDGNKWSIDQGDWKSPHINVDEDKKFIPGKGFLFFLLTLGLLASCLISFL